MWLLNKLIVKLSTPRTLINIVILLKHTHIRLFTVNKIEIYRRVWWTLRGISGLSSSNVSNNSTSCQTISNKARTPLLCTCEFEQHTWELRQNQLARECGWGGNGRNNPTPARERVMCQEYPDPRYSVTHSTPLTNGLAEILDRQDREESHGPRNEKCWEEVYKIQW